MSNPKFSSVIEQFVGDLQNGAGQQAKKAPEQPKPEAPTLFADGICTGGKVPFSEVFGFVPPSGIDHMITRHASTDWPADVLAHVPERCSGYMFPEHELEVAMLGLETGENVAVTGAPGWSKSSLFKEICARTGRPFMRFNGKDGMEPDSLLGKIMVAPEKGTYWADGLLPYAVRNGYTVLFDEWTKLPSGVMMAIQWLLEDDGQLLLDDKEGTLEEKLITPHPEFRLVFADNTKGLGDNMAKAVASNVQDYSTLNRFGVHVTMSYPSAEQEIEFLRSHYPQLTDELANHMTKFAGLVRTAVSDGNLSLDFSPGRTMLKWVKFSLILKDTKAALGMVYRESLADDAEKGFLDDLYNTVFIRPYE